MRRHALAAHAMQGRGLTANPPLMCTYDMVLWGKLCGRPLLGATWPELVRHYLEDHPPASMGPGAAAAFKALKVGATSAVTCLQQTRSRRHTATHGTCCADPRRML